MPFTWGEEERSGRGGGEGEGEGEGRLGGRREGEAGGGEDRGGGQDYNSCCQTGMWQFTAAHQCISDGETQARKHASTHTHTHTHVNTHLSLSRHNHARERYHFLLAANHADNLLLLCELKLCNALKALLQVRLHPSGVLCL